MFNNGNSNMNNSNFGTRTTLNADNNTTVMLNNQTTSETNTTTPSAISATGTIPKEKSSKSAKQQQPRKPPPTIETFWPSIMQEVQSTAMVDAKHQALPLARIKKIMKLDENARMIAAEAPLLFAKACEFFIQELTMRAWIHTDESKRRTLQRSDIAQAIASYDQFDFLIDIVPREDIKPSSHHRKHHSHDNHNASQANSASTTNPGGAAAGVESQEVATNLNTIPAESVVPTAAVVNTANTTTNANMNAATPNNSQPAQVLATTAAHPMQYFITLPGQQATQAQLVHQLQQQSIPAQQPMQYFITPGQQAGQPQLVHQLQQQSIPIAAMNLVAQQQPQQQVQVLQQVMMAPTGEIANVPITINANQLLRLQQQQQQQQQTAQATSQQVIMLTPQQLLQLQQTHHGNSTNGPTTAHIVHPQTHQHHGQPTNTIYINAGNAAAASANASMVSTDRNIGNTFRNNC
ncbi:nuclear transcription factor Y subunit gamma [Stomoxys calcitrans]|uniref:Nuclear transcription factor Y subunit gamma n=1 Tax=Stomoxys calcitrans TaxID=35570 RepID=A0A1I8P1P0_STOCA|nr:nuclear transcription factor Y subunit gamma [Stomoxys calcitrans]XP_013109185.1 nuclear transcription factor Y subunit gamma [Stomoxys calcitrans]XP_059218212.1 nuclear transcription factor Y subunit gamma [Stomoxys calcitrans]